MKRVVVGLHDQVVGLVAELPVHEAVLDFVTRALPIEVRPAGRELRVAGEGAQAAEVLMRDLAQALVWDYASGLALHAAALELDGRGLLIPASSGVGKSTLAVALAARGLGFASDELVLVPRGSEAIHALARPAHLKPGSLFLLDEALGIDATCVWRYEGGALLSSASFSSQARAVLPLGAIVFPHYRAGATLELRRLSSGAASFRLLGALVNARNLPESGVPETARLASSVPAYSLAYDALGPACAALVELAAGDGMRPRMIRE